MAYWSFLRDTIQEMEDRSIIFEMIDTILTKKKFKDFFNKNVVVL